MTKECEDLKARSRETQINDSHQIIALKGKVNELQGRNDILENENRTNLEQLGVAHMDASKYREMAEMLQSENRQHKAAIEDLEMKNRLLVDKLNA